MWRCSQCDETVEDTFDVCWNCGASVDDNNSESKPASGDPAVPDPGKDPDVDAHPDPVNAPPQPLGSGGMSRHEVAALICKTLALILFAVASVVSVTVADFLFLLLLRASSAQAEDAYVIIVAAVPVLAMVGIGVIYWKKSEWIASQLVPDDPRAITMPLFTVQDALIVAFSTTGLYFFLQGLREAVRVIFILQTYATDDSILAYEIWPPIIQLALAAWLVLGSRGIVGAIHWCRSAGTQQTVNDEDAE